MTRLLEQALDIAQTLPAEMQDDIARLVLTYTGVDQPVIILTPEEEADWLRRRPKRTGRVGKRPSHAGDLG